MAENKESVEGQKSGASEGEELPAKLIRPRLTKAYRRTRLVEMFGQAFDAPAV